MKTAPAHSGDVGVSENINWVAGQPGGARPALSPLSQSEAGTEAAPTNGRAPAPAQQSLVVQSVLCNKNKLDKLLEILSIKRLE